MLSLDASYDLTSIDGFLTSPSHELTRPCFMAFSWEGRHRALASVSGRANVSSTLPTSSLVLTSEPPANTRIPME